MDGPVFPGGSTLCNLYSDFSADHIIPDGTYASDLNLTLWDINATAFKNDDILIEGVFYIDMPVAFRLCRVKLNPGAQIIVSPGSIIPNATLYTFLTRFFSCDTMWKGIVLEKNSRCHLSYSRIEDAQVALTVDGKVSLNIISTQFNRNFIGIMNEEDNKALSMLQLKNSVFNCTSELNDNFDIPNVDFNIDDPVSFAGIVLDNCSSSIGYFNSGNTFKNLNYGVFAVNSSVSNIKGCRFENAQEHTRIPAIFEDDPTSGCGVAGVNSNIFILGTDANESCSFLKADILTKASNLELTFADFEDSQVDFEGGLNGEIAFIQNNTMNGIEESSAIQVQRSAASGLEYHTDVSYNTISNEAETNITYRGLFLVGANSPTDFAIVFDNIINIKTSDQSTGIRYTPLRSENTLIELNTIDFQLEEGKGEGISCILGDSKDDIIRYNTISGLNFDQTASSAGILVQVAKGIQFCYNTTDSLGYGFRFKGNCDRSQLSQNIIGEHAIGLEVSDVNFVPGMIGVQRRARNEWIDDDKAYSINAAEYNSTGNIEFSLFLIDDDDFGEGRYNPVKKIPVSGWFREEDGDSLLCTNIAEPFLSPFDSAVVAGSIAFANLPEPVRFYTEKNMIARILANEDLTSEWSTYLASMESESEYLLAQAEVAIKQALQMDSTRQADLDSYHEFIKSALTCILPYDAYNYAIFDTVTFVQGLYLDSIVNILEDCSDITVLQQSIKSDRMDVLFDELEDIRDGLDTIVTRGTFDEKYKNVHTLHINKLMNGTLSPSEDSLMLAIALDEADSSLANLLAFEIFQPCSEDTFPQYLSINKQKLGSDAENSSLSSLTKADINYENNSSMNIGLVGNSVIGANMILEWFDLSGRLLGSQNYSYSGGEVFNLDHLPSGLYIWKLSDVSDKVNFKTGLIPILK